MWKSCLALLAGAALAFSARGEGTDRVINLEGVPAPPPAWKAEPPVSMLHLAQFRLKGKEGDAQLVLHRIVGGNAPADNVERWREQFVPPDGQALDDLTTYGAITVGGTKATRLDVGGTWKPARFDLGAGDKAKLNYKTVVIALH